MTAASGEVSVTDGALGSHKFIMENLLWLLLYVPNFFIAQLLRTAAATLSNNIQVGDTNGRSFNPRHHDAPAFLV